MDGVGRMLLVIVAIVGCFYLGLTALAYFTQTGFIFPAGGVISRDPADLGWKFEDVALRVGGETTRGWLIKVDEPKGTVLFSHGNAGTMADRLESAGEFRSLGFDVLLYDYGGYGNSTGKASEARCNEDIRAMWRYLTVEKGVSADRIVLFGRSLGGGVTADLAAEVKPAAVILESTFLSVGKLGQEKIRFLPVNMLVTHRFDNESKMSRIASPVLIIHSSEDKLVPFHHGRTLFELANEPKQFLEIQGGHNDGHAICAKERMRCLRGFLAPLLK